MGKHMYLTLGPSSSCEHTLFCLNQDGNSVTERSRVASQTAASPPPGLRPELALCTFHLQSWQGRPGVCFPACL